MMPSAFGVTFDNPDFSWIGDLPKTYAEAQQRQRENELRQALQGLPTGPGGVPDYNAAVNLALRTGNLNAVAPLAQIVNAQATRQQSAAAQANTERHQRVMEDIARKTLEGGKLPFGWSLDPQGMPMATPGGPHDPNYIQQTTAAREKPRQMSVTDIDKLSEQGGKFSNLTTFTETWRPEFGGYKVPAVGAAANVAGRYLPEGVVGKDVAQGAAWWQSYDKFKNVVRNELFGASLTKPEQAAFAQADIDPGMDPKQIEKNLGVQKLIVTNGLIRKANAMINEGYDPKTIAAAYGLDLSQLGVTAQPTRGPAARQPQQPQPATGGSFNTQNAPPAPPVAQRRAGNIYATPKGPLMWTGTGWVEP
jgi:hypothetical protein